MSPLAVQAQRCGRLAKHQQRALLRFFKSIFILRETGKRDPVVGRTKRFIRGGASEVIRAYRFACHCLNNGEKSIRAGERNRPAKRHLLLVTPAILNGTVTSKPQAKNGGGRTSPYGTTTRPRRWVIGSYLTTYISMRSSGCDLHRR